MDEFEQAQNRLDIAASTIAFAICIPLLAAAMLTDNDILLFLVIAILSFLLFATLFASCIIALLELHCKHWQYLHDRIELLQERSKLWTTTSCRP